MHNLLNAERVTHFAFDDFATSKFPSTYFCIAP